MGNAAFLFRLLSATIRLLNVGPEAMRKNLFWFIALVVASSSCSGTGTPSQGSEEERWNTYEDPAGMFSVEVPPGWTFRRVNQTETASNPPIRLVFFASREAASAFLTEEALQDLTKIDSPDLLLSVWVLGWVPEGIGLKEFAEQERARLEDNAGYRQLAFGPASLNGQSAYDFTYEWRPPRGSVPSKTTRQVWLFIGEQSIFLSATASSQTYQDQVGVVNRFVSSLRITGS